MSEEQVKVHPEIEVDWIDDAFISKKLVLVCIKVLKKMVMDF